MLTNIKFWGIIIGSTLAILVALSIAGHLLETKWPQAFLPGSREIIMIKTVFFVLFLILAFSLAPFIIGTFLYLQQKIGNSGHFLIAFLMRHQERAVIAVWMLWLIGLMISSPYIIKDFFLSKD